MYEAFYNLREKPFDLHPDPDYLFMSQGHDNAYTHLEYAIAENKGFVIITGEIGSGKTTLINYFLNKIQEDVQVGLINNTHASFSHFTKMICQEFELDVEDRDWVGMLDLLHEFLLEQYAEKKRVVLIIDEAQHLTPKALEEIRMISNLEAEKHHLMQIILVGQPELKHKLQRRDLEQFAQRVTVHCHLGSLNIKEVDQYIRYRLKVAGAERQNIFRRDAIESIHKYSKGIPRLINIICDTALVFAFADARKTVDKKIIDNVIESRKAGGIFSYTPSSDESEVPEGEPSESVDTIQTENRIQLMEQRISMLESMVDNMAKKLNKLSRTKDERDAIILELFKMLKSSIESRINALVQFSRYKNSLNNGLPKKPNETKARQSSPFFLRLIGKKGPQK